MIWDLKNAIRKQNLVICKGIERRYRLNLKIITRLRKVFHLASRLINWNETTSVQASLAACGKLLSLLIIIIASLILLLYSYSPVSAQNAPQKGITVVPSIEHIDLALDPAEYELTYTNNTDSSITLEISVQDFTALEDNYQLEFLQGIDANNYKYSLSSWISFENKEIELNPGEKKSIKVFIDKNRITKGGHYASILAEIVQPQGSGQINVKTVLSSLLFVWASPGQEIEDGKINDFIPLRDGIEYPDTYILRFQNNGNVHVIPYGLIQVYGPLGNLVAKGELNQNSLDALPESIRRYDTQVAPIQKFLLPGIYTATLSMHFGKTDKKLSSTVKFFSQGSFDFVKIGLLVIILLVLAIYYRKRIKHQKVS